LGWQTASQLSPHLASSAVLHSRETQPPFRGGRGGRGLGPPSPPLPGEKKPKLAPSLQTQQFTTGNPNSPSEGGREGGGPRACLCPSSGMFHYFLVFAVRTETRGRAAQPLVAKGQTKGAQGSGWTTRTPALGGEWPAGRRATVDVHQAIGGGRVEQRRGQMPLGASGGSAYVRMFTVGFQVVRDCVFTDRVETCLSPCRWVFVT